MIKDPERRRQKGREAALRWRNRNPEKARAAYRAFKERWRKTDPEGLRNSQGGQNLRRKGLTIETFGALLTAQGGRCAICRTAFADNDKPCIDHDHRCCPKNTACPSCIRGLLCRGCNVGLGSFKDNIDVMLRALAYLAERV